MEKKWLEAVDAWLQSKDLKREPDTEYVLSLSYGKDSIACLFAIILLGLPLDRIIHAEVWATDTIPADVPPMVEFKVKADQIIFDFVGLMVEHLCAVRNGEKLTYEKLFYHVPKRKNGGQFEEGSPAGFPYTKGAWCNDRLKTNALDAVSRGGGLPVSHSQSGAGARSSKTGLILGFPMLRGQWCTSDLKRRVFPKLPCTRSEEKYCAVPRHCG